MQLMLRPAVTLRKFAEAGDHRGAWLALRRPLALAAFMGCVVSLLTSGRITLRLALPGAIYWSFVPIFEAVALAVVCRSKLRARSVDLFFTSNGPWFLWLTAFSALWAFRPPGPAYEWIVHNWIWYGSAWLIGAWCFAIDYQFFRRVERLAPGSALGALTVQRLLTWGAGMAVFVFSGAWSVVAPMLGL
jgi:hypothetical protein